MRRLITFIYPNFSFSPVFLFSLIQLLLFSTWTASAQETGFSKRTFPLDIGKIMRDLEAAPLEFSHPAKTKPFQYDLPMPGGKTDKFYVSESPVMSADFRKKFPLIKTYAVQSVSKPAMQGRLTVTPNGFFAVILTAGEGIINIRPVNLNVPVLHEVSFDKNGLEGVECSFDEIKRHFSDTPEDGSRSSVSNGATRRTYELAIVTTGEFHDANGGSVAAATAVVTASVSAIQLMYDRELAIRFTLLTPYIYTNYNTDPFNPASGLTRTQMAAQAVAANFAIGTYDFGHVFHDQDQTPAAHSGGGVAALGVICNNSVYAPISGTGPVKAAGWSGSFNNTNSSWYGLAAHEFGHMFNMNHTFNGSAGRCSRNISLTRAYEIPSGNSIMSYNGLCGSGQNVPSGGTADQYFHANSLSAAITYISGQSCHTATSTGNTPPVINANPCGATLTIPKSTPFTLTGSGTDANGDQIYYSWEQYDEDGPSNPTQGYVGATAAASTIAPLFRSYPPATSPSRTFPNINLVAANDYTSSFEALPSVARTINFRLTGRDWNANGGGMHCQSLALTVSAQGPLTVVAPNGGGSIAAGSSTTVTWNLNGITFLSNVNIKLSTDGGLTYPYTLAANTPAADGTETVTIPAGVPNTSTARIRVESADFSCLVFFDISNSNFSITSNCAAPASEVSPLTAVNLPSGDPGLNLGMTNNLGTIVTNFAGTVSTGDADGNLVFLDNTPPACLVSGNVVDYDTYTFSPDMTGTYTFTHNGPFGLVLNLYAAPFTGTNCTNHLASNATRPTGSGSVYLSYSVSASLTAGNLYVLTVGSFGNGFPALPAAYTISFTKPSGSNIYNGVILPAGYAYTYLAVNSSNNQVAMVNASSNFTALGAGSYLVYGATYKSGGATPPAIVNPVNWVGQTLAAILSGGDCAVFSSNARPVTVTPGSCTPPTVTAPAVTQPDCAMPSGTILVNASGGGTLEYSVNNGTSYQSSATFSSLPPGSYQIKVRLQSNPSCTTSYTGNPVAINSIPNYLAVNAAPIPNGPYDAVIEVTSGGAVNSGGNVIFRSGTSVELQAGFEVMPGGVFEVILEGCD